MVKIINIQKFSIHDGDGIRTTVFFKGCPLSCAWCHNPESQCFASELLFSAEKCVGCGACVEACPQRCIGTDFVPDRTQCTACGQCVPVCAAAAREVAGEPMSISDLVYEIMKDEPFYEESGGGVTLSGGEVLAQDMEIMIQLLRQLKRRGIHVAIDTCGYVPFDRFERVLPYTDLFLYDLKGYEELLHEQFTGKSNQLILDNLKKLAQSGAKIYARLPLIEGVNTGAEEIAGMLELLKEVRPAQVHLLPYHNIGNSKNDRLQRPYDSFTPPSEECLQNLQATFERAGLTTKIGG